MKRIFTLLFLALFVCFVYAQSIKTFSSVAHNVKYEYNSTKYQPATINNAPHMLLKLHSNDGRGIITLSTSGDMGLTGYNAHHPDLVEYFKTNDSQIKNVQNGVQTSYISSCEKVTIGNSIKALKSIVKATITATNEVSYSITYRFVNESELQLLILQLPSEKYHNLAEVEKELTKGLSFIK